MPETSKGGRERTHEAGQNLRRTMCLVARSRHRSSSGSIPGKNKPGCARENQRRSVPAIAVDGCRTQYHYSLRTSNDELPQCSRCGRVCAEEAGGMETG